MEIKPLILRLLNSPKGNRDLDLEVATVLGWTKKVETVVDGSGEQRMRVLWMIPGAENVTGKVPDYTTNIHAAYLVAEAIVPGNTGGCSWEPGKGSAQIEGWPAVQASTPALALCVAALRIKANI